MRWTLALVLSAGVALAHAGVKDPQVMARMHGMKDMQSALGVLAETAKGERAYDAQAIEAAVIRLREETEQIEALFTPKADDPKSEALPVIWTEFEAFRAKANDMAAALPEGAVAEDALGDVLREVGAACKACHQRYRE